jgi:6-phosphogluconolactonase
MGGKQSVITLHSSSSIDESIKYLLPELTVYLEKVIQEKNHCTLALAGGNTPKPLYKALSEARFPWEKISITLTDERWVAVDHEDSNENMIKHILLNQGSSEPFFIPLKNDASTVEAGAVEADAILTEKLPQLDIVILGMGDDGHFASIFPQVSNLNALLSSNTINKCLAVSPSGKQDRISLTYSYLINSKIIFLLISGEQKNKIIDGALNGSVAYEKYPIYTLLNQTTCPVQIYWNI